MSGFGGLILLPPNVARRSGLRLDCQVEGSLLTVLRGRKVKMVWHGGHLRIDSRVFLPPKKPVELTITLEKQSFKVLVPSLAHTKEPSRQTGGRGN